MPELEKLKDFKRRIDPEIGRFFDKSIKAATEKDYFIAEALRYVKKLTLAGGKRLRPAFIYYGYLASGGKEKKKILKAAVSIELVHIYLLIHDDVIDRDVKRHGLDTVNLKYEKAGKNLFPRGDYKHFGESMAIIIGDMVGALGNQIIYASDFDSELIVKALHKLQEIVSMTVIGQAKDVNMEYRKKATEEEVISMYESKTARYTVDGPLHLGAILGGADDKFLKMLSSYALPIGIAFQVQDDILGIFGSEEKLGKSVGSDIESGKQTLLVVKARERANEEQRKIISEILGKSNVSAREIKEFQKVIVDTGALRYAENLAQQYINEGKKHVEKAKIPVEAKSFLLEVADYMKSREF